MIRLTIATRFRSGAEVLVRDSGPIFNLIDARRLVVEVQTLLAEHGDAIVSGKTELIVRCATREFEADGERPRATAPPPPLSRRERRAGEF
jgi:hypothetical protein